MIFYVCNLHICQKKKLLLDLQAKRTVCLRHERNKISFVCKSFGEYQDGDKLMICSFECLIIDNLI